VFIWHQENKNTSSKSQRNVSLLKKNLVSRNELREIENIGARDVNVRAEMSTKTFSTS